MMTKENKKTQYTSKQQICKGTLVSMSNFNVIISIKEEGGAGIFIWISISPKCKKKCST